MLQFRNVSLSKIAIHHIGNKGLDQGLELAEELTNLQTEGLANVLLNYFLKPFGDLPAYSFHHPVELGMNESYTIIKNIFLRPTQFLKESKSLGKVLYEVSTHPKIKSGELYICYFKDLIEKEETFDGIGIFKSENLHTFLQVERLNHKANILTQEGISTEKLDKGCLILKKREEKGYQVYLLDQSNKEEAQYWKDDFLQLRAQNDEYHSTTNVLQLTKQFVLAGMPSDPNIKKTDQIEYLNRSIDYFKENEQFNIRDFEQKVFQDESLIKSYQSFGSTYVTKHDIDIASDFEVSNTALKKQARHFKTVIKLDKNFHIYIHGNRDLIEQGIDERTGRKYYKLYFDEEK